jgi:hypothetical protein
MTPLRACRTARLVDRHFALRISPREERALREHLTGCQACAARYERHLALESLNPSAANGKNRLAVGLGLEARRASRAIPVLAAIAACALLAGIILLRPSDGNVAHYSARGDTASRLFIYRVPEGGAPTPIADRIARSDELAFAYENGAGRRHLLVFAVDEHRHVYWYHPAWDEAARDPVAVAISTAAGVHELPEAIGHAYDGSELTVHALFTDEALSVRTVERWISTAEPGAPFPKIAADEQQQVRVKVNR